MSLPPNIIQIVTGDYEVNTYIVSCPETRESAVIDPGGDAEKILQILQENNLQAKYIINTHGHADHILANQPLQNALNIPVCMHEDDYVFFTKQGIQQITEKELGLSAPAHAEVRLKDGEKIQIGQLVSEVLHTPGHTPGSICLLVEGNLFTGDTLFVGDVGRSDLTGGSFDTLLNSIKDKILPLPTDTTIWPGHNYGETPTSTLAWEIEENPYITDFILADD